MSKNKKLLEDVSKYFTEDTLKNIAQKVIKKDIRSIEVVSWHFENASGKGDSYLSTVDRVTVKVKVSNEIKSIKIVVKSLPNNLGRRKTYRSGEFFRNEIMFYAEVNCYFKKNFD